KVIQEKTELIIPLIRANRWRGVKPEELEEEDDVEGVPKKRKKLPNAKKTGDDVTDQAVQEIIDATQEQIEEEEEDSSVIPLLLKNKVPGGFETDDKLNVDLRPDEANEADYDQIPVESYGMAMLRGMGFNPAKEDKKRPVPINALPRPKGLGLGADRSVKAKKNGKVDSCGKSEDLVMKTGAYCVITKGKNDGYYGQIEGLDEDNVRAFVKLTLNGESVTVSQMHVCLVSQEDYKKNSKYLNKSKADRYKEEEAKKAEKASEETRKNDRKRTREERKEEKRGKHRREEDYSRGTEQRPWLMPHLRVRIVDKKYRKGRHYKEKVTIEDVLGPQLCICRTDDHKVLDELKQDQLETVVPRSERAYIMVINGKHRAQIGQILDRSKSKCTASVQLLTDRDRILTLDFDSICEYTGDIDDEQDY
ncbi:hypothetical protein CAPTEDRAFT_145161, partial [Capitella teleta]